MDFTQRGKEGLDRQRFVLGAWLLGRLWDDASNTAALRTFTAVSWFEDVQGIFDLAEMPHDDLASGRLVSWVLWGKTSSSSGPADISIDTSTPILRMLVGHGLRAGCATRLAAAPQPVAA